MDISKKQLVLRWLALFVWCCLSIQTFLWVGRATHFLRVIPKDKVAAVRHALDS